MGNLMQRNKGTVQATPQQGGMYAPYQQQPIVQQQPQYVQQPGVMQQPQYAPQQPQFAPQQPQFAPQQPQFAPQQSAQYRPSMFPPQQGYRPAYPSGPSMPQYPVSPPLSLPTGHDTASYYENDSFLANLTGWSVQDIERLRHEFLNYANPLGVIDRDGFRKLYIASLLNMTWEAIEHDAEAAFRNFDINQTGGLDFNEYITACSRMSRDINPQFSSSSPQMNQSFIY